MLTEVPHPHTQIQHYIHTQVTWAYRVGQLQDVGSVRYGATVAGVPHQGAGQEHGAEVIAVQDVHGERGGGRAPLTRVRGPVLTSGRERKLFHLFSVDVAISDLDLHIFIYLFILMSWLESDRAVLLNIIIFFSLEIKSIKLWGGGSLIAFKGWTLTISVSIYTSTEQIKRSSGAIRTGSGTVFFWFLTENMLGRSMTIYSSVCLCTLRKICTP